MGASKMNQVRAFFCDHRRLAALLVALALAMKLLVPAGYMLDNGDKVFTVHICSDQLGQPITEQLSIPASEHGDSHKTHSDTPCPFSALGHASLGGVDPLLLALALVFLLALGFAEWRAPHPRAGAYLRPPLRGPPALS